MSHCTPLGFDNCYSEQRSTLYTCMIGARVKVRLMIESERSSIIRVQYPSITAANTVLPIGALLITNFWHWIKRLNGCTTRTLFVHWAGCFVIWWNDWNLILECHVCDKRDNTLSCVRYCWGASTNTATSAWDGCSTISSAPTSRSPFSIYKIKCSCCRREMADRGSKHGCYFTLYASSLTHGVDIFRLSWHPFSVWQLWARRKIWTVWMLNIGMGC